MPAGAGMLHPRPCPAIEPSPAPNASPMNTRTRRSTLAALGLAAIGLAVASAWSLVAIGSDTSRARDQLAAASSARPISATQQFIWNTTDELDDGIDDANDNAIQGHAELQLARETGDPVHYARAEKAFQRAIAIDAENVEALIGMGTLALARHDFARGLELGKRALALNDSIPRIYGLIGDAQVELGRYEEALATVQHMVNLRPDLASYSRVSYLRELHGDLPGAIEAMELALEAGGPNAENTEYVRVQLGHLHFAVGDLASAEAAFTASLQRLPGFSHATAGLARVRAAQGNVAEAIQLYHQATERVPLAEHIVALGEAYEAMGRDEEARDQYELAEAMQALFEANGVETDLELAAFFADHGDPQRAVALARDAYARTPTTAAADILGWALLAAGDVDEAAQFADEALRLGGRSSRILFHAGMIAEAAGQPRIARERLQLALELNPAFSPLYAPVAAEALARLKGED